MCSGQKVNIPKIFYGRANYDEVNPTNFANFEK